VTNADGVRLFAHWFSACRISGDKYFNSLGRMECEARVLHYERYCYCIKSTKLVSRDEELWLFVIICGHPICFVLTLRQWCFLNQSWDVFSGR
jgi:hypothetical protein